MFKHIKIALILLSVSFLFMFSGIMQNRLLAQTQSRGNYFFEKTRNDAYIQSLVLNFPEDKKITFTQTDGLWHIREADDYYADFSKINTLIKIIRDTTIYRADKIMNTDVSAIFKEALSIKSIDSNGKIVDEALIAPKQDVNKFYYAMLNHQPLLYQLNGQFELSPLLMDWVHSPILALPYKQIKRIKSDTFNVYRRFLGGNMLDVATGESVTRIQNLAQHFWYLSADDIKHALHFNREKYDQTKSFTITSFDGCIYQLTFFYNQQEYWVNVKLDREKIVSPAVIKSIKENTILYDGWYFKINPSVGAAITNFIL